MITVHEAAAAAGRNRRNIYRWIQLGYLKEHRTERNKLRIDPQELETIAALVRQGKPLGEKRKPATYSRRVTVKPPKAKTAKPKPAPKAKAAAPKPKAQKAVEQPRRRRKNVPLDIPSLNRTQIEELIRGFGEPNA